MASSLFYASRYSIHSRQGVKYFYSKRYKMIQDPPASSRRRGRPRAFDTTAALGRARDVFWRQGYAAASLDDLAGAMGINRPSLYAAFGDKQSLYVAALAGFSDDMLAGATAAIAAAGAPQAALLSFYRAAIDVYTQTPEAPLGCFVIGTAVVESATQPVVRQTLAETLKGIDALLTGVFTAAGAPLERAERQAKLAANILHGLAVRARAGAARQELEAIADDATRLLLP
jgi:TetR/AcrR family transcriptional regulator, copper-responsive repressor